MGLSDLSVRKLAPKKGRYEVLDANGLYIRVAPTGYKSWVFRYNFEGVARKMTLGGYPGIGLAEARLRHAAAAADLQRGIDPGAEALAKKAGRKKAPTFSEMLQEFNEAELSGKRSGPQTLALLKKDCEPLWGKRKVADIKRRDIVLLLDDIKKRAPIVRNRVHGALTRFFNFSAERGAINDSPCTRIRKVAEGGRSRVLSDNEIKLLWKALDLENKDVDLYRVTKLALKMILLTGQRPGEVAGMQFEEIDTGAKVWNIPAQRMKGGEDHAVPLCPMALSLIETARPFGDGIGPIFRSSHKTAEAMTRHAITRAVSRHWKEMGIEEAFTPHDLRRTVRTRLAELGVDDIHAERLLGHKLQGMLRIYNQHSYLDEKRNALLKWESQLLKIIEAKKDRRGNVIQLAGRR